MVLSVGKCPIGCIVGGLIALSCGGDAFTLTGFPLEQPEPAAVSGSGAPAPSTDAPPSGAGVPVAGVGYDGVSVSMAGAGAGGAVGGSTAQAGNMSVAGQPAGEAGSSGRWWLRGGSSAAGAAGVAGMVMEGAGGSSGMRGMGEGSARAGSASIRGGSAGAAADGCVQNLACQLSAPPSTGDAHQDCVDRINQFRQQCACLPALERWVEGEACADEMAKYDSTGTGAHAAFAAGICNGGSAQNECPGWRSEEQIVSVCLQRMWDEGPPPMSDCTGSCFQMYGHFLNMTNKRMTKVACGFYAREDGQVWSVQNFAR